MKHYQPLLATLRDRLGGRTLWLRRQWQHVAPGLQASAITNAEVDWLLLGETRWTEPEAGLPAIKSAGRLTRLKRQFRLNNLESWTLFACLAPELDAGMERIYAYAQDNPASTTPTAGLMLSLCGEDVSGLTAFLPTAPLRDWRLLQAEGPQPLAQRPLAIDERLVGYLLGDDRPDARIAGLIEKVEGTRLAPSQESAVLTTVSQLQSGAVNLIGPALAGHRAVAEAACQGLKLPLFALNLARLAAAPEPEELARLVAREMRLQGAALLIEEATGQHDRLIASLTAVLPTVMVASRDKLSGTPLFLKPIGKLEQAALWREQLPPGLEGVVEDLVESFDLTPGEIAEIATARDAATFRELCRQRGRKALDGLAHRLESRAGWSDLVLPPDTERHLREIAAQCRHRFTVYERWGFGARLSRGRGVTALFSGPSGCGKTTAAEVLAGELQMDLYRIDLAGMVSKYIGETEKNLRKVFDAAEQAGAILFFDEADALFGKRSEVKDAHDRYANIEIDYLLQRMEEYRGMAILATNMRESLDKAFLRRLRYVVDFPFPQGEERLRLWQQAFPAEAQLEAIDCRWLARLELAGGNISTIAVNSAFLAAGDGSSIRMEHVVRALVREYAKLERPLSAHDLGPYAKLVMQP